MYRFAGRKRASKLTDRLIRNILGPQAVEQVLQVHPQRVGDTGENRHGDRVDLAQAKIRIDHEHSQRRLIDERLVLQGPLTQRLLRFLARGDVHRDAGEAHGPALPARELHSTGDLDPTLGAVGMSHTDIDMQFSAPARLERLTYRLEIDRLVRRIDYGVERLLNRERALRRQLEQRPRAGIQLRNAGLQIPNEGGH